MTKFRNWFLGHSKHSNASPNTKTWRQNGSWSRENLRSNKNWVKTNYSSSQAMQDWAP